MSYEKNIKKNRQRSAQDRAANDLHERLEKLLLTGRESAQRRWFWELLQNARDMAGEEGVRVRVAYTNGELCFQHNGKVFNSKELSRLTEQDSSKRDEEGPDRSIGRFGTGFLTTHLLSPLVRVKGVVHDDGEPPKPVELVLDRRGDTPAELRKGVEQAFAALDDLDKASDVSYTAGDFNTSFCYELKSEGEEVVETGLADLRMCLPLTLALNDKIASVEVVHEKATYSVYERVAVAEGAARVSVKRDETGETTRYEFIVLQGKADLKIALPLQLEEGSVSLVPLPDNFPRLFCAFPLIGSEEFPLPIVLNSEHFHPTEPRNGILVTDADHYKPLKNKELIKEALPLYWRLLQLSVEQNWTQKYVLADVREAPALDWLSQKWCATMVTKPIRKRLLREPIMETEDGGLKPFHVPGGRMAYVPQGQSAKSRRELWRLKAAVTPERLPKQEHLEAWHDRIWTDTQRVYPLDLLTNISATEDLRGLSDLLQRDETATIDWLGDVVQYLQKTDNTAMLDVYRGRRWYLNKTDESIFSETEKIQCPVLPDQLGQFKLLRQLHIDKIKDEALKDVLASLGREVRAELLHPGISVIDESHKSLTSEDLAKDIEDLVRERISGGNRHKGAFLDLLRWFDKDKIRAKALFPALYKDQHLLQTAEEAKAVRKQAAEAKELSKEVKRLRAKVERLENESRQTTPLPDATEDGGAGQIEAEHLIEAWAAVKNALGELGEAEHSMALKDLETWLKEQPGLFEHVHKSSKEAYIAWIQKVYRAKAAVKAELSSNLNYNCTGWTDDNSFPTIVQGVVYRGLPITMVIRPADGGFIVLYDDVEKHVLSLPDAELWIEGGGFEAQRMTLGKLASWLGVNRLPLKVHGKKPILLHLS